MHDLRARVLWLLLPTALLAQRPDTGPKNGMSRLTLEATLLGGAPPVEALEINGRVVTLAELRAKTQEEGQVPFQGIVLENIVLGVLRDDLIRRGSWLDDAAYEEAYAEYAAAYDNTPFSVEVIATKFKRYQSLEVFQRRWRVREAFVRALPAAAFSDEALAKEAEASRDLLLGTGLEVELWLHVAADAFNHQLGFTQGTDLAQRTLAALRADANAGLKVPADVKHIHLGGDRPILINQLRTRLRESEFTTLLRTGVADTLFAAEPGKLLGPLRGSDMVYVARVIQRHEKEGEIDLGIERNRELVRELRKQRLFREWIDEIFRTTVIRRPKQRRSGR